MAIELTTTTVSYLFAAGWAPPPESGRTLHVPGAEVDGSVTAANLLNLAVWSLREQGFVEVEMLRPVESEPVTVMGGKPFVRVRPLPGDAVQLAGLEGALLTKARVSSDEERGLRRLVLDLGISGAAPWEGVASFCLAEARTAGLVEVKGRLSKKPVISDPAAVEALRKRDAEIAVARARYRDEAEDLDDAAIADCLLAIRWAHETPSD